MCYLIFEFNKLLCLYASISVLNSKYANAFTLISVTKVYIVVLLSIFFKTVNLLLLMNVYSLHNNYNCLHYQ